MHPAMGELVSIFLFAILAMFNPTLLAAVTVMMLLPNPKTLMFGYLMGAYLTSISVGMLVVFSLDSSEAVGTTKRTLSPAEDIVLGLIALLVAYVLAGSRAEPLRERRRRRKEKKELKKEEAGKVAESLPERLLGRGSARVTFAVGVVLSFPGVSYLSSLDRIAKLDYATVPTALLVLAVALIQQLLLEAPLLGYAFAPERTERAVKGFRIWLARSGSRVAAIGAAAIGALLLIRGVLELLL
jgi:hypothetical protein